MPWLWLVTELAVEIFAAWTLAVHACMVLGLPAWCAWPLGLVLAAGFAFARRDRFARARTAPAGERTFALAVLGLGLVVALPALVLRVPSGDDFNFFHRALWQIDHLGAPITMADTAFGVPGLMAISPLHALTSWEIGLAMTARALGLDALGVYHNGAVVLGNVALVALAALWLRELGFRAVAALAGTVGVVAFLYADEPGLRSWAIAYRMLWVGKMVQWLVVLPAALLFAWRYLRAPSPSALWHPALLGVCAVGTSGTGVLLLPGVLAAASLAGLAFGPIDRERVVRCGLLNLGSLYCVVVAGLVFSGVLPAPDDMRAWVDAFPAQWLENLRLVTPDAADLARNALLALGVPALVLRGDARIFLVGFGLALIAIFLNPLLGPLWLEAAKPGAYWRVMLLFPVPLGAGIALAALVDATPTRAWAGATAIAAALAIAFARWTAPPDDIYMAHRYDAKRPLELRLPADQLRFLSRARGELEGRRLLAAQGVSATAALLVPSLRIEAGRLHDTRHVFSNAGMPDEATRRLLAWEWASRCPPHTPSAEAATRASISAGVDAVIAVDCGGAEERDRQRVLGHGGARFALVLREEGYALYLRTDGGHGAPRPSGAQKR